MRHGIFGLYVMHVGNGNDLAAHFLGELHIVIVDQLLLGNPIIALFQIANTYIAGEDAEGLLVIDQHAAHMRVLYEQALESLQNGISMDSQELLFPELTDFSKAEKAIFPNVDSQLKKLGFHIGTGPCHCVGYQTIMEYTCSNGKVFPYAKDGLVYTKEEYEAKFPSSSSSEASSSSAVPSPLCQKTGFVNKNDVSDSCIKEKLDSLTATGETVSDSLKTCLQKSIDWSTGEYAKTQICDGDTTVNPRYQAKLDSIREEVDKAIKDCRAAEDSVDSTKVPADSTVTPIDTAATSQE